MKARAYYFKWKFLWISWVLELGSETTVSYSDNVKNLKNSVKGGIVRNGFSL